MASTTIIFAAELSRLAARHSSSENPDYSYFVIMLSLKFDCCYLHFAASLRDQSQREKAGLLLGRSIHLIISFKDFHHVFDYYFDCFPVDSYRLVCGLKLLWLFSVIIGAAVVGLLLAAVFVDAIIVVQKQN